MTLPDEFLASMIQGSCERVSRGREILHVRSADVRKKLGSRQQLA